MLFIVIISSITRSLEGKQVIIITPMVSYIQQIMILLCCNNLTSRTAHSRAESSYSRWLSWVCLICPAQCKRTPFL